MWYDLLKEKKIMEREIIKDLLRWKEAKVRKPLIIHGARQVRKNIYSKTIWKRVL